MFIQSTQIACEAENNTIRKTSIYSCFKCYKAAIKRLKSRRIPGVYCKIGLGLFKRFIIYIFVGWRANFFWHIKTFVIFLKYINKNPHFLRQMDVKQLDLNRQPCVSPKHWCFSIKNRVFLANFCSKTSRVKKFSLLRTLPSPFEC